MQNCVFILLPEFCIQSKNTSKVITTKKVVYGFRLNIFKDIFTTILFYILLYLKLLVIEIILWKLKI